MRLHFSKLLIILLLSSFFLPLITEAVSMPNPIESQSFFELLNKIIDFIFAISIPITALMIIIAGFYFITAQGEPEKIQTAKRIIIWALIGFLIVLLAKGLIKLLEQIVGIQTGF